jgi:hypothetical protein
MFVRWAQFCAMGTIIRFHTNECCDHRPWSWGTQAEDAIRAVLELRYSMMPMLVAAGRRATADGTPLVKRLDLEWPEMAASGAARDDQYLLAEDTLVAPVIPFPNVSGTPNASRAVWVPPGTWLDGWSGAAVVGPQLIHVGPVPFDQIPLWHRQGSLHVTAAPALSTAAQDWSELTVHIFPFAARAASGGDGGSGGARLEVTRHLYDTKMDAQAPPRVALTLSQAGDGAAQLLIGPGPARRWRLRFHLLATEALAPLPAPVVDAAGRTLALTPVVAAPGKALLSGGGVAAEAIVECAAAAQCGARFTVSRV